MTEPPLKRARTTSPVPGEVTDITALRAKLEVLRAEVSELDKALIETQRVHIKALETALDASDRTTLALSLTLHSYANVGAIRYVYNLFILVKRRVYPGDDDYEQNENGCRRCFEQLEDRMASCGTQYVEELYFVSDDLIGITSLRAFLKSSVKSTYVEKLKTYVSSEYRGDVDRRFRGDDLIPTNPKPGKFNNDLTGYLNTPHNIVASIRIHVVSERLTTKTSWRESSM